jgi:hypothetical protein
MGFASLSPPYEAVAKATAIAVEDQTADEIATNFRVTRSKAALSERVHFNTVVTASGLGNMRRLFYVA